MNINWVWFNNDENKAAGFSKAIYTLPWAKRVAKKLENGLNAQTEIVDLGHGNYAVKFSIN